MRAKDEAVSVDIPIFTIFWFHITAFLLQIITGLTEHVRCGICYDIPKKPVACVLIFGCCVMATEMRCIILKASPVTTCFAFGTSKSGASSANLTIQGTG